MKAELAGGSGRPVKGHELRAAIVVVMRSARVVLLVGVDAGAWTVALIVASFLRLDAASPTRVQYLEDSGGKVPLYGVLTLACAAIVLHTLLSWMLRVHQGRHSIGSFEEMFTLASIILTVAFLLTLMNAIAPTLYVARTTPLIAAPIALFFAAWPRGVWRIAITRPRPNQHGIVPTKVLIMGAGAGGRELVRSMQRDARQRWQPVAFLDDDPRKKHFRYQDVRVRGTSQAMERVARRHGVKTIIIAMPSVKSEQIKRIYELARAASLEVKILPGVDELLDGVQHTDVRDLRPEDLLGRHQVDTDLDQIAEFLQGRRVMVTGAGGSIGSELCRQIFRFSPGELIMLDRDESALHSLLLSLHGTADLDLPNVVLANIRDEQRIRDVFARQRPEVVFHAAALKHVNMLEKFPDEAVKTNITGTHNVLAAAAESGVHVFVNISTDKAADPQNVLGCTKRLAEGLTAGFAHTARGAYVSVRFGNVLGTRGSVLRTFTKQIENGGPVTVTDPNVTRFFMTVGEAVQLVLQAAAVGQDGDALVLDMGEPVRILDVAHQMIEQSGRDVNIVYTGLKPGEKLHEVLFAQGESDAGSDHRLISRVGVQPLTLDELTSLMDTSDNGDLIESMSFKCKMMSVPQSDEMVRDWAR